MLKSAILRLKEKVTESNKISKSDIAEQNPNLEKLNGDVTKLLEAGSLLPETEKIAEWARSQGLEEAQANVFAQDTVDSYFKNSEEETKKSNDQEKENVQKSELLSKEIKDTFEILKAGQETLAEAIEYLLEKSEENSKLKTEFLALKSQVGNFTKEKEENKNLVLTNYQKSNLQFGKNDKEKISNAIIKGIEQGRCQIEDISFFEATYKLSDRAEKFLNENKENII
ncbi:hypothetical protein [Leptospira noguchii]|uniref:Uncharacterized protein n=1 Tax=Leptospira noguchii serovar Autumnalis str. ZUN142 TaxID=1085540 RepID=M6UQM5_9LEPT|nr:hypothetical protein [Leptospira noguchii]EMO39533.1 hypothetical protein LEP1GSC186_3251 [Leptospira noguchii serovar Autumnalis str. ZUN142]UOG50848.1 hypothetical protein MAL00_19445 [Leptospira noguchii]